MKKLTKELKKLRFGVDELAERLDQISREPNLSSALVYAEGGPVYVVPDPKVAMGLLDDLEVDSVTKAKVNVETKITFTATNPIDGPLDKRDVVCEIIGSSTASIADAPAGSTPRNTAALGNTLTLKTNTKGKAIVYALSGMVETFQVKGTLSGSAFQPTATTTVKVS